MIALPGNGPPRTPRNRVWAVIAAAGVALLVVAAAAAMTSNQPRPRDFGVTSLPAAEAAPEAAPEAAARPEPSLTRPAPPTPPPHAARPVQVTIPVLGVQALVSPVGTSNGELGVPTDPAQLGWWTGSARVGATEGTVVIDGHVDSAKTGPGALFRLQELQASDRIVVATATGERQTYLVTGRRMYTKTNSLPPELFATNGPPRLVLITCGGPFDARTRNYLDNIVVFAAPA